jgi:hypothetical protein
MSQYNPQRNPYYPPESNPEEDYIYDEADFEVEDEEGGGPGNSVLQRGLIFLAGGCVVFLCMACCGLLAGGLYALDAGSLLAPTPIPGSDIGLSSDEAAKPDEKVVNDQQTQLAILDVNRNASLEKVPAVEGRELIIVTVELTNLGTKDEVKFNERDFLLLNASDEAYQPLSGDVIDGALGHGTLPTGEGLEGRLVFEVIAGESDLILAWEGEGGSRYINLE